MVVGRCQGTRFSEPAFHFEDVLSMPRSRMNRLRQRPTPNDQRLLSHTFHQARQQGCAAGQFGNGDELVHGVSAIANTAQPI